VNLLKQCCNYNGIPKKKTVPVYRFSYDQTSSAVDYRKRFDCYAYSVVLVMPLAKGDKIVLDVALMFTRTKGPEFL